MGEGIINNKAVTIELFKFFILCLQSCFHSEQFKKCIYMLQLVHLSVCPHTAISELDSQFPLNLILRNSTLYMFQFWLK